MRAQYWINFSLESEAEWDVNGITGGFTGRPAVFIRRRDWTRDERNNNNVTLMFPWGTWRERRRVEWGFIHPNPVKCKDQNWENWRSRWNAHSQRWKTFEIPAPNQRAYGRFS
jgi:hypothetical protein